MKRLLASWGVVGLLVAAPAFALPEYIPIQEKAMGHSLNGAQQTNESLYSNPAGSSFSNVYSVEGTYGIQRSMAVSIIDTRTSTLGGGLGYFRTDIPGSDIPMQGVRVGLATRANAALGLGASGKFLWGPGANGESLRQNDLDVGSLYNLNALQLGVTVRNLFGGQVGFDQKREWVLGARANYEDVVFFSASATATTSSFNPYQYGLGMEYVSPYYFGLKGGYRFQPSNGFSTWSLGFAVNAPKLTLLYAVEFVPETTDGKTMEHTLSAAILF